jgi:hypothetical protein
MSRARRLFTCAALAIVLVARLAAAACGDVPGDGAALEAARAAVTAACTCDTTSHREYVRCADGVLKTLLGGGQLSSACRKAGKKCASRSTCGKSGAVTCCRPRSNGVSRCKITTPDRCTANGGCVGQYTSCCDACGQSGCATTSTTTTSSTTTTTQASTCGNGIIEAREWCDGQEFCEANCTIRRFACCELPTASSGLCSVTVPASTLLVEQHGMCGTYGGTFRMGLVAASGDACAEPVSPGPPSQQAGACVSPPDLMAPASVCCQDTPTSCSDSTTASQSEITNFVWNCLYAHAPFAPIVAGTCGPEGLCVPAQPSTTTTTTAPCGFARQPCCDGTTCAGGLACIAGGMCDFCGLLNGPCCTGVPACISAPMTRCVGGLCVPS